MLMASSGGLWENALKGRAMVGGDQSQLSLTLCVSPEGIPSLWAQFSYLVKKGRNNAFLRGHGRDSEIMCRRCLSPQILAGVGLLSYYFMVSGFCSHSLKVGG